MPPRLFVAVDPAEPDIGRVDAAGAQHVRALRLERGAEVVAIVAPGCERRATLVAVDRGGATFRLGDELARPSADPRTPLVLAIAVADLARMDLVVEKATELGATAIWPFAAERSQRRDVPPARLERWSRIARAACEQCGRTVPPAIERPTPFAELCVRTAARTAIVLHPEATAAPALPHRTDERVVVVGPEGGLTAAEVDALVGGGAHLLSLGPRLLRFETAAIVGLVWASLDRGPPCP